MPVSLTDRRNTVLLVILALATISIAGVGSMWLRTEGYALIEEVSYLLLVLIAALFIFDRLFVQ